MRCCVSRYRATSAILALTMINLLVNHPGLGRSDLSSLERVLYGAPPMPPALLERAMKALGCEFQQAYGMTETSPVLTILQPEDHRFDGLDRQFAPVRSAGRPIFGMEVRVADAEDRPMPAGQTGNAGVLEPSGGKSRGAARRLDAYPGSHEGQIKTGGENVYSPEVEAVLVSYAEVLEAAVIGGPMSGGARRAGRWWRCVRGRGVRPTA